MHPTRAIGMLRDDELPGLGLVIGADRPVPGRHRRACLVHLVGSPRELASAVRLALYWVTQEALTNVRTPACLPPALDVRLSYLEDELTLTIEDFSANPPACARHLAGQRLRPHRHARASRTARGGHWTRPPP